MKLFSIICVKKHILSDFSFNFIFKKFENNHTDVESIQTIVYFTVKKFLIHIIYIIS